jgi:uncharacterized glyoxalase superfamily protein PhnB
MSKIPYRPEGFHTVNPYLLVRGAAEVIDFMKRAFGAEEIGERYKDPPAMSKRFRGRR